MPVNLLIGDAFEVGSNADASLVVAFGEKGFRSIDATTRSFLKQRDLGRMYRWDKDFLPFQYDQERNQWAALFHAPNGPGLSDAGLTPVLVAAITFCRANHLDNLITTGVRADDDDRRTSESENQRVQFLREYFDHNAPELNVSLVSLNQVYIRND